jgi:hypothetical protein
LSSLPRHALNIHAQAVEIVCGAVVEQVNASSPELGKDCPPINAGFFGGNVAANEIKFIAGPPCLKEAPKLQSNRLIPRYSSNRYPRAAPVGIDVRDGLFLGL